MQTYSIKIETPEDIARYFVFLERNFRADCGTITYPNTFYPGRSLYKKHREKFDKLFELKDKLHLDLIKYIKFFVTHLKKTTVCIDSELVNINIIRIYADYLAINEKYKKIYEWFNKSVKNIVSDCIKLDFLTVNDYFKYLITEDKLAQKYITGEISEYFLAGINNIDKLIKRTSYQSQDEMFRLIERKNELNSSLQDAFMFMKSQKVNPISYANEFLYKCRGIC